MNANLSIYRNLRTNNFTYIKETIHYSIFKDIDIDNFNIKNVIELIINKLMIDFYPILSILANNEVLTLFDTLIFNLRDLSICPYKICNQLTLTITTFCKSLNINFSEINTH